MEGDETKKNGGIELDWDKLLPAKIAGVVEEEPQLVVVPVAKTKTEGYKSTMAVAVNIDENENEGYHYNEELRRLSDVELNETVKRLRSSGGSMMSRLPDGGKKIIASLKRHEIELERRKCLGLQDDGGCKKPKPLDISTSVDASDSCREGDAPSRSSSQSKFAACFVNKLDKHRTESITPDAYEKKMSSLNRCESIKMRSAGPLTSSSGQKKELSARETPFRSDGNLSGDTKKRNVSNHDQKDICFSARSPRSAYAKRLRPFRGQTSSHERHGNGEHVVLVDEEELEAETMATQENSIGESTNARIYYPSRDDSESVEISYSDMQCLAPEQYLSSTIMNFYIRYMQCHTSLSGTGGCNYHIFNTYFYEKLKEAVNKSMEEAPFAKFRRWWKGVNLFEKAYVLLPIHEDQHWSLVIICIPDKDSQSGPIVLHLDSLGFHYSKPIFSNIRRFLTEEWTFVKEEALVDLPLAKRVWEKLPRRIDEKSVEVPQQRNDFDCGLFVLFFMKKFIAEAPERAKSNNFTLFSKKWFKPEEASRLRREIRSLLKGIFEKSQESEISGS